MAHGAGPVVHGDLAGGYAMSERVGKCAMPLPNMRSIAHRRPVARCLEWSLVKNPIPGGLRNEHLGEYVTGE